MGWIVRYAAERLRLYANKTNKKKFIMKYIVLALALMLGASAIDAKTTKTTKTSKKAKVEVAKAKADSIKADSIAKIAKRDSLNTIVENAKKGNPVAQNTLGMWYYKGENYAKDYKKAFAWWSVSAKQMYPLAFGNLGVLYQLGQGVEADSVKAVKAYVKSIELGNITMLKQKEDLAEKKGEAIGAIVAGICYKDGKGVKKDVNRAIHFFEIAAKANSVEAYKELGFIYQRAKKGEEALKWFALAADKGDMISAYQYAKVVLTSNGTVGNEQTAMAYLIKAAEGGVAQAQCDLGQAYYKGSNITKDATAAVNWFRKAAGSGWALAQWNLAMCLIDGNGTAKNYDEALYWLGEASANGFMGQFEKKCAEGENSWVGTPFMTYMKGMALYFSKDKKINEAYAEFKKIKKESVDAQVMMAVCLANKNYSKPNAKKAVSELKKLTDNAQACFFLAALYEAGNGVEKDEKAAVENYTKSADAGYASAQCYLGNLYFEGRMVGKDLNKAVAYYAKADALGQLNETAAMRYADCYVQGLGGLKADAEKAEQLKKKTFKNNVGTILNKIK